MSYTPLSNDVYRRQAHGRVAGIRRPPPPPRGVQRIGLGDLGATNTTTAVASTVVSEIPVVGPLLANIVGPIVGALDPGAKIDASRKQRADAITKLANEGSLLAARQLYGAAEKGAVGAAKEKAWYAAAWGDLQQAHPDIATAARAAGPAGVGPDPHGNPWSPPASDVAQYTREIQQYQQYGTVASAAQAAGARTAGFPGGVVGIGVAVGIAAKLLGIL